MAARIFGGGGTKDKTQERTNGPLETTGNYSHIITLAQS